MATSAGKPWWDRVVPSSDRVAVLVLVAVSVVVRLPFLRRFDLVSFDGTYYINEARALWTGVTMPGQFPIGYPLVIAPLLPLPFDDVLTAQVVSFLFALGSLVVLFHLARVVLSRRLAFCAALVLSLTPLFIRLSMETFSESPYTFWMLLTLLLYARRRDLGAGLAAGMAAITRPEMLALAGLLALWRAHRPARAAIFVVAFLAVYAVDVGVFYRANHRVILLHKTSNIGVRARTFVENERDIEESAHRGGEDTTAAATASPAELAKNFAAALPRDVWTLARHSGVLLLLLAFVGAWRRPTFLLLAMVPMLSISAFAPAPLPRFFLPYLPIVVVYAFAGAAALPPPLWRRAGFAAVAAAVLAGAAFNRDRLTEPTGGGYEEMKVAGVKLRQYVRPGDKLADRKPYTAFYAGATYVEIPLDNYDETMDYLMREDVRFLSLYYPVIDAIRPVFSRLITDEAVVQGEFRYKQVIALESGLIVYERTGEPDPLRWQRIGQPVEGVIASLAWSPDGATIAYVRKGAHQGAIYAIAADGSSPERLLVDTPGNDGHPAWSRDGRRLAFASTQAGPWNLYILDVATGAIRQVTDTPANDGAPSWLAGDRGLVFVSSRGGARNLWTIDLATGDTAQLTSGGDNNFPAVSPSGERVAWIVSRRGVGVMNLATGEATVAKAPHDVAFYPAWSPDGRFIAVTGDDWGNPDVYLLTADGAADILLTKNAAPGNRAWFDGHPAWSPDGKRIAVVSDHEGPTGIYLLSGFEPYLERLRHPMRIVTFEDLGKTGGGE